MSWWTETLTEMVRSSLRVSRCQRCRSEQALSRTQRPISVIRPPRSASGTSTVGDTTPRDGCAHRRSASTPVMRPVPGLDDRLVLGPELAAFRRAAQVAFEGRPLVGPMLLAQVDDLVAGAALALRLVHRGVGVLQELLRQLIGRARERDADARGHQDFADRQVERCRRPRRRSASRCCRPATGR